MRLSIAASIFNKIMINVSVHKAVGLIPTSFIFEKHFKNEVLSQIVLF